MGWGWGGGLESQSTTYGCSSGNVFSPLVIPFSFLRMLHGETVRHDDNSGSACQEAEKYKGSPKGLPCSLNPTSFNPSMASLTCPPHFLTWPGIITHPLNVRPMACCRLNTASSSSPAQQPPHTTLLLALHPTLTSLGKSSSRSSGSKPLSPVSPSALLSTPQAWPTLPIPPLHRLTIATPLSTPPV